MNYKILSPDGSPASCLRGHDLHQAFAILFGESLLGPLDALNHLFGFFLPALVVGPLAAALAKLVWRNELRGARWARLALWSGAACAIASVGGLVVFGRDGMMATYGAMVLASALALLWAGFGPGRR